MSVWMVLLLQAAPEPPARTALPVALPRITTSCRDSADAADIVVCGTRPDRYRLPLPVEPADTGDRRMAGEAARASAALTPGGGACGVFAGQRTCAKAEAARYGYGRGRDPVTVLGRLARKLADPDADLGEPDERR